MINKQRYEMLLKRLDAIQKEVDAIHQELLIEFDGDNLSESERNEINDIIEENDFKTLEEWQKENPLD